MEYHREDLNAIKKVIGNIVDNYDGIRTWKDLEKAIKEALFKNNSSTTSIVSAMQHWAGLRIFRAPSDYRIYREIYEIATVKRAFYEIRRVRKYNIYKIYQLLVELFNKQLRLVERRTSETQILEQFSTPLPIAFLLGWWTNTTSLNTKGDKIVIDPTGGNGMLLFYYLLLKLLTDTKYKIYYNELDVLRSFLFAVAYNGFYDSHSEYDFYDYVEIFPKRKRIFDSLLINPPFSRTNKKVSVTENGKTYSFRSQDFAMVTTALNRLLADNGRAACIIGGHRFGEVEQSTYWDKKGRPKAGEERDFWFFLFENYNVVDVLYIDGKRLWAKQGQETNLRIILIDGRKKVQGIAQPPLYSPNWDRLITQWSELWDRVGRTKRNLFQLTREKLKNNG